MVAVASLLLSSSWVQAKFVWAMSSNLPGSDWTHNWKLMEHTDGGNDVLWAFFPNGAFASGSMPLGHTYGADGTSALVVTLVNGGNPVTGVYGPMIAVSSCTGLNTDPQSGGAPAAGASITISVFALTTGQLQGSDTQPLIIGYLVDSF
jgi:hypothetical protein